MPLSCAPYAIQRGAQGNRREEEKNTIAKQNVEKEEEE